jgi:group I intron endonuclease
MIIYKITNLINGKVYIGQTKKSLNSRWSQHKYTGKGKKRTYIACAIQKYGIENFKIEKIDEASSIEELDNKEKKWILHFDSINPEKGYNMQLATIKTVFNEDIKRKISESKLGKPRSEETKKKISKSKLGKKMSKEFSEGISARLKGRIFSEEHKQKLSKASKGRKKSEEHKRKIGEVQLGKTLSQESIKKREETKRLKKAAIAKGT